MAVKNNVDGTRGTYVDSNGVERYTGSNNRVNTTTNTSTSTKSSGSSKSSGTVVDAVDYRMSDGSTMTVAKSQAEAMDKNRTDGQSGIVGTSANKLYQGTNYASGGTSTGRETMYDFTNNNTGEKKTIYSDYTNYTDAAKNAGFGDGWKLDKAVSYYKPKTGSGYVADTSEGGFADVALKQMQAADYLYGANSGQLDADTRKYLQGIIDGSVSTAGVNFGNATTYGGLLNGSTSKGTYDNLDLSYLGSLLEGNTRVPSGLTDDVMTQAEHQTYINGLKNETQPAGSTAYTGNVALGNGLGNGVGNTYVNSYGAYDVPAYNGLTADEIKDIYGSIYGTQEQMAANNMNLIKQLAQNNIDEVNDAYDKTANQAFVQSELNKRNLPQLLKAQGLSGGASESSQLAQQLNYENNINNNEVERAKALQNINQSILEAQVESDNNLLQIQATLQQNMLSEVQNAMRYENEYNQWVAEYRSARTDADRAYAMQQAQLALAEKEDAEAKALEFAITASEYGDFSQLEALGVNTNGAQQIYNANLRKATIPTSPVKTQAEIDAEAAAKAEAETQAKANALLNQYILSFETKEGQENAFTYLQSKYPELITDERYKIWSNSGVR